MDVEPRQYRLRLLNGCDSRFLVVQFIAVELNATNTDEGEEIDFYVIGADQGLGTPTLETVVVMGPAQRYDIIFDFADLANRRIILKNIGGDEPFGGDIPGPQLFEFTDRIMAFDVVLPLDGSVEDGWQDPGIVAVEELAPPDNVRRLALMEGHDQFGRLQPLLATIDEPKDINGNTICYPNTQPYRDAGLVGPMIGTQTWHAPTTENIAVDAVEDWEIWNLSADAHPLHLHLVSFQLIKRERIKYDSGATEDGEIEPEDLDLAVGDGTYFTDMAIVQHDGTIGEGYRVVNPTKEEGGALDESDYKQYVDNFVKDTIVALPGQVTTIRARFDKPGEYNWHCHILAHEDHEMMRIFHVGEMPEYQRGGVCPSTSGDDDDDDDDNDNEGGDGTTDSSGPIHLLPFVPLMVVSLLFYILLQIE
jgi:spore coat protein A